MVTLEDVQRRDELVAGLRELADLFERNGGDGLPLPNGVEVNLPVTAYDQHWKVDVEKTQRALRRASSKLGRGRKEKIYDGSYFTVIKRFGPYVSLSVFANREVVCERRPTGQTILHPAQTLPEREEVVYEWVCPDGAVLALTNVR